MKKKRLLVSFLIFFALFVVPVTVYTVIEYNFDTRGSASELDTEENRYSPQIVSVPETSAKVGNSYSYTFRVTDADGNELSFLLKSIPSWLNWNEQTHTIAGNPSVGDIGLHLVEVSISDGKWLSTQRFQIQVTSDSASIEEQSLNNDDVTNEISEMTAEEADQVAMVLGTSDENLPDTAISDWTVIVAFSIAAFCSALYFFLDSRFNLTERIFENLENHKSGQISFDESEGFIVDKKDKSKK